ncbi:MAG: beta-ketoacyl synthase N-terminal-like domain-containing protein, partial [Betaproteobacteria bacterium]
MKKKRVAITGLGLVTPAGNDVASTWATLQSGRSMGAPITTFDATGFSTRIAAEVKGFDPREVIDDRRLLKFANRALAFAIAAADQAIADAGVRPTPSTSARWGLSVGTGMQGMGWPELSSLALAAGENDDVDPVRLLASDTGRDPMVFCRAQSTAGLALLGRRHRIGGYATSVHTACASGG